METTFKPNCGHDVMGAENECCHERMALLKICKNTVELLKNDPEYYKFAINVEFAIAKMEMVWP